MEHEGSIFTPSLRGVKIDPECPIFSRMDSSPVEYGTLFHSSHNCSAFECVFLKVLKDPKANLARCRRGGSRGAEPC